MISTHLFYFPQQLIKTIGDEDLMELALPRLSKAITVWEFLLMKVGEAHSQDLPFREILQQFESVRKHVRLFADECLERVSAKQEGAQVVSDSNKEDSSAQDMQSTPATATNSGLSLQNSESGKQGSGETEDRVMDETSQEEAGDKEDQIKKSSELVESGCKDVSPGKTGIKTNDLDEKSSSSDSKLKTVENGSSESDAESKSMSVNKDEETRTENKQTDSSKDGQITDGKQTESSIDKQSDDQTVESSEMSSAKYSGDSNKTTAKPDEVKTSKDFLELESEIAKALDMEPGKYIVKEWMTTKLPAMYNLSKTATNDQEESMSEGEDDLVNEEAGEIPPKKQKMNDNEVVGRPMPAMQPISNSVVNQAARQVCVVAYIYIMRFRKQGGLWMQVTGSQLHVYLSCITMFMHIPSSVLYTFSLQYPRHSIQLLSREVHLLLS